MEREPDNVQFDDSNPGSAEGSMTSAPEPKAVYEAVVAALRTVFDPEIPVNIYDLGLIYRVDVIKGRNVEVDMTLTAPGCPVAGEMLSMAKNAIETVEAVASAKVNLVFDPPWDRTMMSEEAQVELGLVGF